MNERPVNNNIMTYQLLDQLTDILTAKLGFHSV